MTRTAGRTVLQAVPTRLSALLTFLCAVALSPSVYPAGAQSNLETLDVNRDAPDVVEFLRRQSGAESTNRVLTEAKELGLPDDQFFAALDPGKRQAPLETPTAPKNFTEEAAAQPCAITLLESDPDGDRRGWFEVEYGAPCNMALYCNWIVDRDADLPDLARTREREVDPSASNEMSEEDDASFAAERSRITEPDNAHSHGYDEIAIRLVLAGTRDCTLTRFCDGRDDLLCTEAFLNLKAREIAIQQLGK